LTDASDPSQTEPAVGPARRRRHRTGRPPAARAVTVPGCFLRPPCPARYESAAADRSATDCRTFAARRICSPPRSSPAGHRPRREGAERHRRRAGARVVAAGQGSGAVPLQDRPWLCTWMAPELADGVSPSSGVETIGTPNQTAWDDQPHGDQAGDDHGRIRIGVWSRAPLARPGRARVAVVGGGDGRLTSGGLARMGRGESPRHRPRRHGSLVNVRHTRAGGPGGVGAVGPGLHRGDGHSGDFPVPDGPSSAIRPRSGTS
jgi:hypothetical protein